MDSLLPLIQMQLLDYLYLARKDLLNYKLRTSLIITCIAIGILASTINLYWTLKRTDELLSSFKGMGSQLVSIWISDETISQKNLSFLPSYFPNISYQVSVMKNITYLKKKKDVLIIGVTPPYKVVNSVKMEGGRFITDCDIKEKRRVCVVGLDLAKELRLKTGSEIRIDNDRFRLIGIFSEGILKAQGDQQTNILIPIIFKDVFKNQSNSEIIIYSHGNPDVLRKNVERILKARFPSKKRQKKAFNMNERFFVASAEGLGEMVKRQKFIGKMIVLGIGLITLILAGGGIINLMMLSIRQRYKEIGVMRAIGAKRSNIFYFFLTQGIFLSIYGLCLGGGLGGIYVCLKSGCRFDLFFNAFFTSSLICIPLAISGLYPALKASHILPIEAIRTI